MCLCAVSATSTLKGRVGASREMPASIFVYQREQVVKRNLKSQSFSALCCRLQILPRLLPVEHCSQRTLLDFGITDQCKLTLGEK